MRIYIDKLNLPQLHTSLYFKFHIIYTYSFENWQTRVNTENKHIANYQLTQYTNMSYSLTSKTNGYCLVRDTLIMENVT